MALEGALGALAPNRQAMVQAEGFKVVDVECRWVACRELWKAVVHQGFSDVHSCQRRPRLGGTGRWLVMVGQGVNDDIGESPKPHQVGAHLGVRGADRIVLSAAYLNMLRAHQIA